MPENPVAAAIAQQEQQLNTLVDVLGLRLLDPTIPAEFRQLVAKRVAHLLAYLQQLYPEG